jgi:hypothetical protein
MSLSLHVVCPALVRVFDVAQVQRTSTVLVALELGDTGLGRVGSVEADDTSTSRSTARLVLNLGLFDFSNRCEKLDKVVIASGPWQLSSKLDRRVMSPGNRVRRAL